MYRKYRMFNLLIETLEQSRLSRRDSASQVSEFLYC